MPYNDEPRSYGQKRRNPFSDQPSSDYRGGHSSYAPYQRDRPSYGGGGSGGGGSHYGGPKRARSGDDFNLRRIDWASLKMPPFQKDFYKESAAVAARDQRSVDEYRKKHEIAAPADAQRPVETFAESGLPDYLQRPLEQLGFPGPTPIQAQGWPVALSGRDMIGIAQTGSGKTLAYLVPSIVHINAQPPLNTGDGPIALILAPTRELATQISEQIPPFSKSSRLLHAVIYGGAPKSNQLRQLNRGVDIVVATPGRLLDFLSSGATDLKRVTYLVLDEADRMLDMGFEKPIRQILSQIRPERQTVLFSATWPKEIQALAAEFLERPVHINIGSFGISSCKNVHQDFEIVEEHSKTRMLLSFLSKLSKNSKVLIFVATKLQTDQLKDQLCAGGFYCGSINGDKHQNERETVLQRFRTGEISILIGTDVASRGIDIKDIMVVVNFDFPNTIEDYVHRIGRTGRASAKGQALTMLTRKNANKVGDIIMLLQNDKKEVPSELREFQKMHGGRGNSNNYRRGGGVFRGGYQRR